MRHSFAKMTCAGTALFLAVNMPAQNLFEADNGSGNINEFTPGGAPSMFVSGLTGPGPLAFDSAGNLYAGNNGVITEITPGGKQSTFASIGPALFGLAFNTAGDLFTVIHQGSVIEIAPDGTQSTFATGLTGAPQGVAFDSSGNLFVADDLGSSIFKIAPDGTVSIFATTGESSRGVLAFDSQGDLFTAKGIDLYEFTNNNGDLSTTPVLISSVLSGPTALAFDSAGDLFESDGNTGRINEFINNDGTLSSTPTIFASGLNQPEGLAFAPVPEPSALALLAAGSAALFVRRRKN